MVKVKFILNHTKAKEPKPMGDGSVAFGLYCTERSASDEISYGYIEYKFGMAVKIPDGYVGKLYPVDSIAKTGMILANSVKLINPNSPTELSICFKYIRGAELYGVGDMCAQIRIEKSEEIEWERVAVLGDPPDVG